MTASARVGTIFAEFRLEVLVGAGAYSATYAAKRFGEAAAIRVLSPEAADDRIVREAFVRMPSLAAGIRHPGVVGYAEGEPETYKGELYHRMELCLGNTLTDEWREGANLRLAGGARSAAEVEPTLSLERALFVAERVLSCLAAAHESGVVHGRLTPEKLLVGDEIKVLDFGLVPYRGSSISPSEATPYMAPEVAMGLVDQVDSRADLFSVAAIVHALVTGKTVHSEQRDSEFAAAMATLPAPLAASVAPWLRADVCAWLDRALAWDRRERFDTATAMRDGALEILAAIERRPRSVQPAP